MLRVFLSILFLAFSSLTFASELTELNGVFHGEGKAWSQDWDSECEMVEVRFRQVSKDEFIFRGGGYRCGDIQAEYPYSIFKVQGKDLYYEGEKVGRLQTNRLTLEYNDGEYSLIIMRRASDGMVLFREHWKDSEDYLTIHGKLNKL